MNKKAIILGLIVMSTQTYAMNSLDSEEDNRTIEQLACDIGREDLLGVLGVDSVGFQQLQPSDIHVHPVALPMLQPFYLLSIQSGPAVALPQNIHPVALPMLQPFYLLPVQSGSAVALSQNLNPVDAAPVSQVSKQKDEKKRAGKKARSKISSTREEEHWCRICNKRFTESKNCRRHKRLHTDDALMFACSFGCGKTCTRRADRDKHEERKHRKTKYRCLTCTTSRKIIAFGDAGELKAHKKSLSHKKSNRKEKMRSYK